MKLYLKVDIQKAIKRIIQEQAEQLLLNFNYLSHGELEVSDSVSTQEMDKLQEAFNNYGIEILESQKSIQVQKIKDAIIEMVYLEDKLPTSNSSYLCDKLKLRYSVISSLFSEVAYTSIENYIILQKTERAKQLITTNELTFSEIAYMLNYSSVAHFSNQFKKVTGLTPTAFQRIINKRRGNNKPAV
jgi:AraC-like DNA-binding protein